MASFFKINLTFNYNKGQYDTANTYLVVPASIDAWGSQSIPLESVCNQHLDITSSAINQLEITTNHFIFYCSPILYQLVLQLITVVGGGADLVGDIIVFQLKVIGCYISTKPISVGLCLLVLHLFPSLRACNQERNYK